MRKHCPVPDEACHYVIIRADLPHGSQVAQAIHAAGESAHLGDIPLVPGTVAVALGVPNQDALLGIAEKLRVHGIGHHVVKECDGEAMAIGLYPTRDRTTIKRLLSSLPLIR